MQRQVPLKLIVICLIIIQLLLIQISCKPPGSTNNQNGNGNPGGEENPGNTETLSKWQLWSNGTRLRGVNIYQRRIYPELDGPDFMGPGVLGPSYIQADFDKLAAMGANYVNISHSGIFDEIPPYSFMAAILENLQQLIQMIGQADMFSVISARTGPGRSEFTFFWGEDGDWFDASYYNDTIWTVQSAQDAWVEMWREVARRFVDDPNVVGYDLMVEPNANDVYFDLWNPFEYYLRYHDTLFDWNQLYKRVSEAIREIDSETPILISGMGYSAVNWLPYLDITGDEKTVYMFHQYDPHKYTHQEEGGPLTYPGFMDTDYDGVTEYVDKSWLDNLLGALEEFISSNGGNVVAGCNEYGVVRWVPGAAVFMDDLMDLFEQRGINYALWDWGPSYEIYTDEVNAFNFRFGPDPDNTRDLQSSQLIEVIKKYWSLNTYRPSNVTFK
jgi:Cellulase (glycosyl hydrolase family 5)